MRNLEEDFQYIIKCLKNYNGDTPTIYADMYMCKQCGQPLIFQDNITDEYKTENVFCRKCGQRILWDDK